MEGIPELTLNTHVNELTVLCETIVDFKNLKDNGFDFSETLEHQELKGFFERLSAPVYSILGKQFWMHPTAKKEIITSYVMNRKIGITEKSIVDLISHNGKGKRIHSAKINAKRETTIAPIIFKAGTNVEDAKGPNAKDLTNNLRLWFKIILGCIHHRPNTNSSNYGNTRQKFMLFFLEKGLKLTSPSILLKFMRDSIRESRTGGSSNKRKSKFIPNGRIISDLLVENGLVDDLLVGGLTDELVKDVGKIFWGKNINSIGLIYNVVRSYFIPSKDDICGMRILVDNFPIFTKIVPPEILMDYLESCLKGGIDPMIDPFNLPGTYPDVYGKRKKESKEEGSSRPQKKKKKVDVLLDEDEMPLSESHKEMLLNDTSGVVQ
ncbi:uncharacterized protein LOC127095731 [Lathyrus oleraceus]|uniref:uncharacterized protein LOC127095731 n=1 Tax=Pisum sativum TaxID=3888 RepID=UPI0021D30B1F|nr:uncharacterized protein LOC127095731 [Pisum sativum]